MSHIPTDYEECVEIHKEALKFAKKSSGSENYVLWIDAQDYSPLVVAMLGVASLICDYNNGSIGIYDDGRRSTRSTRNLMKSYLLQFEFKPLL